MFSGIVEEVGSILEVVDIAEGKKFTVKASHILADAKLGESISVSGACLTVIEFDQDSFVVEATA